MSKKLFEHNETRTVSDDVWMQGELKEPSCVPCRLEFIDPRL